MNQQNNLIQWKNLTDDEKAGFDFEGYKYEVQDSFEGSDFMPFATGGPFPNGVYRLKIEPDKWYYLQESDGVTDYVIKGSEISPISTWPILRPATQSEIPKPKRVFKNGAHYPFYYRKCEATGEYDAKSNRIGGLKVDSHNISWIGEELNIDWGKK